MNGPKIFRFGIPGKRNSTPAPHFSAKFCTRFPERMTRPNQEMGLDPIPARYFPISKSSNVLSTGFGRGFGFFAVGGTGSFCSVPMENT
jgi:hypothetical protein